MIPHWQTLIYDTMSLSMSKVLLSVNLLTTKRWDSSLVWEHYVSPDYYWLLPAQQSLNTLSKHAVRWPFILSGSTCVFMSSSISGSADPQAPSNQVPLCLLEPVSMLYLSSDIRKAGALSFQGTLITNSSGIHRLFDYLLIWLTI